MFSELTSSESGTCQGHKRSKVSSVALSGINLISRRCVFVWGYRIVWQPGYKKPPLYHFLLPISILISKPPEGFLVWQLGYKKPPLYHFLIHWIFQIIRYHCVEKTNEETSKICFRFSKPAEFVFPAQNQEASPPCHRLQEHSRQQGYPGCLLSSPPV